MRTLYLCYSQSSIPRINEPERLSKIIIDVVRHYTSGGVIGDALAVELVSCQRLRQGWDAQLVIADKVPLSGGGLQTIIKELTSAIQKDQKQVKPYRVDARVESDFSPSKMKALPAPSTKGIPSMKATSSVNASSGKDEDSELDYEKRAQNYVAVEPEYTFDRVILPAAVSEKIQETLDIFKYQDKVFKEWGLSTIEPHPSSSLSFYGPSGTGKTMAAEAIASQLGKKILRVSYADIESKFHGEGPKMVKAIFYAAQRDDAVLFIDEADSLLSKRLTNVSSGSEQAINSMRSQLLISLERFEGIVIFATNLVVNYDQAFLTRLISVEFTLPEKEARKKIWEVHVLPGKQGRLNIPLAADVDLDALAEKYEFCGREIKKAVISACLQAAIAERESVCQADFLTACDRIVEEEKALAQAKDHTVSDPQKKLSSEQESTLKDMIKVKLAKEKASEPDQAIRLDAEADKPEAEESIRLSTEADNLPG